ncbi:MAG: acyltransferase [Sporichthyaceae bacterium]
MGPIRADRAALPGGVPALDGVRGVAALLVVLSHIGYQTGEAANGLHGALLARGDFGVALFFVLSGLLLYRPWAIADGTDRTPPPWRRYYQRRAVRILPAYWLVLLVVLLIAVRGDASSLDLTTNLTLTQVYGAGHLLPDFTQTWSLCTEAAFYILLPLVGAGVARIVHPWTRAAALVGVIALSLGWTGFAAAGQLPRFAGTWLPGHAGWFACGVLLAILLEESRRRPHGRVGGWVRDFAERPGTLLALAAGGAALAVSPLAGPRTLSPSTAAEAIVKESLYGVVALLVIGAALVAAPWTPLARLLGSRPARWLGRVGYGVFLWHLLVLDATMRLLGTPLFAGDAWRVGILTVSGALLAGWLSWRLVERPLLERFSRPVSSRRDVSPEGARRDEQHRHERQERRRATARDRA